MRKINILVEDEVSNKARVKGPLEREDFIRIMFLRQEMQRNFRRGNFQHQIDKALF